MAFKRALLHRMGLAVIRFHDIPDSLDDQGIALHWALKLGFDAASRVASKKYYGSPRNEPARAIDGPSEIAGRVGDFGQAGVMFWGDPDRRMRTVCVGTGCYCTPIACMGMAADMYVAVDDTIRN